MNDDIINTKAEPSVFDVLAEEKAAPGEPKFTLWGRDALAPPLVYLWAAENRERALKDDSLTPEKRELELRQSTDAEGIAWAMEEFRLGHEIEIVPPKERAGYTGNVLGADELAAKERHDALAGGARVLHNSLSEALDVREATELYGFTEATVLIQQAAALMQQAADMIRPARPSYAHLESTDAR